MMIKIKGLCPVSLMELITREQYAMMMSTAMMSRREFELTVREYVYDCSDL